MLERSGAESVVSVVEVPHQFNPVSVMHIGGEDRLQPYLSSHVVTRRQDKPQLYARNGPAVLAVRADAIARGILYGSNCRGLVMRPEDSIDIDTPWDLQLVESALAARSRAT